MLRKCSRRKLLTRRCERVQPFLDGIPVDWPAFGLMLGQDQHSDNTDVRDAAKRALDTLLDYISVKIGAR